jgi:hypothetical protein
MRTRPLQIPILCALLATATPAAAVELGRGPYLQLLTTHSVTVVWNTDVAAACSLTIRPVDGATTTVAGKTGTVCEIPVDGLSPGTEYAYTPQADGGPLGPESIFRTDDPARPFTFLVIGDSGSGDANQLAVRDRMLTLPADLLLHTGDMVYDAGAASDFDPKFFTPYRDLIRRLVFWPCRGNRDVKTDGGQPWRDAFGTPANNPAGSEDYYSFDYGNAHFVVLDSNQSTDPASPQYAFADQDLGASGALWKIVVFHHTIYSGGVHGPDLTVRANLLPLIDRYSVDLVLMGQDHDYERTLPLRAGQVVPPGQGTIYITTSGGGGELRPVTPTGLTAYAEEAFHVTRVAVDGGTLTAQMVRVDGEVRDSVTLMKNGPSPKCRMDTDCDDRSPCTLDRCAADGCHHTPLGFDAVETAIDATFAPDACVAESVPATIDRRLERADRLVTRAAHTKDPQRADGLMTNAARRLAKVVGLSAQQDRLSSACATALAAAASDAASRAECLASQRAPVADSYIEAGHEANRNHGAEVDLRFDASRARVAYLEFDLSAVTGVRTAVLDLHVTNPSDDGARIYRVPGRGWREGNGDGIDADRARGAGLRWNDVDVNGDDTLDRSDLSPLVPAAGEEVARLGRLARGQVVHVDVSRAFADGPGLYTLAITSDGSNGAAVASREHPAARWRPRLSIVRD